MSPRVILLSQTSGLNNVITPIRHKFDPAAGCLDLSLATNVDIDDTGKPSRRKGTNELRNDDAHSMWSNGYECYYVSGDALYQFNADWSRTGLRSGLTLDAMMSYVYYGGKTYHANGIENGIIYDGADWSWVGEPYVGPETIYHVHTTPPVGHLLERMGGNMLIAVGNCIHWSLPYAPSWYRLGVDVIRFGTMPTMMAALPGGVWVSDSDRVYWLQGTDPKQWMAVPQEDSSPAIKGTVLKLDGQALPDTLRSSGLCVLWTSRDGIIVGTGQGQAINLTRGRLQYSKTSFGAALVVNGNRYISSTFE